MTMMKDISVAKTDASGERLFYKVQDFVYDDILWQYCKYQPVRTLLLYSFFCICKCLYLQRIRSWTMFHASLDQTFVQCILCLLINPPILAFWPLVIPFIRYFQSFMWSFWPVLTTCCLIRICTTFHSAPLTKLSVLGQPWNPLHLLMDV